jgi:hypothetical protein
MSLVIASFPAKSESAMINRASGEFEVKLLPVADEKVDGGSLGRMSLDKQFKGALQGSSKGEMLTAMTATKGSAGYVAIERFSGSLGGRSGSFVLQHNGTMNRGEPVLAVTVVPDSGTGELAGLAGRMAIRIAEGKHFYDFDYELK